MKRMRVRTLWVWLLLVGLASAGGLRSAAAQSGDVFLPLMGSRGEAQEVDTPDEPGDEPVDDNDGDEVAPVEAPIEAEAFSAATWTVETNLGVGTEAPANRIDVLHNANSIARLRINNSSSGASASSSLYLQTGNAKGVALAQAGPGYSTQWGGVSLANRAWLRTEVNATGLILTTGGNAPLIFGTQDAERARINANGRVGIGTTAPVHKLSVIGGPAWTTHHWVGSIELGDASAIGWRKNGFGRSVGMGHNTGGFYIFHTEADPGTTGSNPVYDLVISDGGWVGIGTTTPGSRLHVNGGNIRVTGGSFIDDGVTLDVPDYVFEPEYPLLSPDELRTYIAQEKHLPNVPSEEEIKAGGLNLSAFQMKLLEKVEELTLYSLAQDEQLAVQDARIADLEARLAALEAALSSK